MRLDMTRGTGTLLIAVAFSLAATSWVRGQTLVACKTGASLQFGAGWCDFATPVNFRKGERLRLAIGGSATRIIVRLLPKGYDPGTPIGVIPTPFTIPQNRLVEVVVPYEASEIVQISVHGGPSPWN